MTHYEEDEFDLAARERGPVGVHRRLEPRWQTYLPYAIVIVLAPLLAWAAVSFLGSSRTPSSSPSPSVPVATSPATVDPTEDPTEDATEDPTDDPTEDATEDPTDDPTEDPTEEPTDEPTDEETSDGVADKTQLVTVLNGSGINGLAGRVTQSLQSDGFTNLVADNYTAAAPAADTIYYNSPAHQAAAEEIAQKLGITNLVESSRSTQSIAIVLRTNVLGR